ncbi:MAG: TMEM165/GDT1 family protein [Firmicutes bacterium]|nr:TMEM165/GDT1 family protein [Bacillota bacterium]
MVGTAREALKFSTLITAFITIFIAEFGDKTQLVSLTMAGRYPPFQVLGGALTALFLSLSLAILAGGLIAAYCPPTVLIIGSGVMFLFMGLYTALKREEETGMPTGKAGFYQTLGMVFIAELCDKTQLAAMLLAANLGQPLLVLTGGMLAMAANHGLAIFLGARFLSRVDPTIIKIITAILFIIIGLVLIFTRGQLAPGSFIS